MSICGLRVVDGLGRPQARCTPQLVLGDCGAVRVVATAGRIQVNLKDIAQVERAAAVLGLVFEAAYASPDVWT